MMCGCVPAGSENPSSNSPLGNFRMEIALSRWWVTHNSLWRIECTTALPRVAESADDFDRCVVNTIKTKAAHVAAARVLANFICSLLSRNRSWQGRSLTGPISPQASACVCYEIHTASHRPARDMLPIMARASYGQFCPVAKTAELLAERWMPLVVRELLAGSCHFGDLRRGIPLISPATLSQRLQALVDAGILERTRPGGRSRRVQYRPTAQFARERSTSAARELSRGRSPPGARGALSRQPRAVRQERERRQRSAHDSRIGPEPLPSDLSPPSASPRMMGMDLPACVRPHVGTE